MKRMTRLLLVLSVFLMTGSLTAQNNVPESMLGVDFSMVDWERGEILVRFADHLSPSLNTTKSQTKIGAVDAVLADYSEVRMEQLFPVQKPIPGGEQGFTTYSGKYYEYPKLTNIYKISFKDTAWDGIFPIIRAFEDLGDDYIVYAEPNYKFETDVTNVPPSDALYQYQYNAGSMNADSAWQIMNDSAVSDEDIIIAIIDTGVDTAHVDLKGKKHINMIEANGQPGVDDDGNGYIDDISGWDFVNMDNGPIDDNSHGTHCAAIAVANHDSVGIAGIAPNAKYLPMKGLESSGGSASSVLAQCVTYAANNGADILSMSFGGYGRSFVMENALSYAYAFSMPVGAAGNSSICIRNDGQLCPDGTPPAPSYPGAYTFVLAVQATQQNLGWNGYRAWFTNYDFDGPTYTDYGDDFNYEVYAPGLGIISAIPNDQYATWNGTSMACPAVAGAMAIYQSFRPNRTKEQAFVDFISSWYDLEKTFDKGQGWSTNFQSVDVVKAIYPESKPVLWLDDFTVIDTANGDGDFKLDAGENVQVRVDIKNVGTEADSVFVGIRMAQYEDLTIIDYTDSVSYIGSISSYATVSNNTAMFDLDVDAGVVNGRNINFNIYCWTPGGDTTSQNFVVEAQSGCEYNGIYPGTTVWTPDCGIIVTGNSAFDTLIIKPGTEIQIDPGVGIAFNEIDAIGKPDSMIVFTKNQNSYGTWMEIKNAGANHQLFQYCVFEYGGRTGETSWGEIIGPVSKISLDNCIVRYCDTRYGRGSFLGLNDQSSITNSVIQNNIVNGTAITTHGSNWTGSFKNNIVHNNLVENWWPYFPPFMTIGTINGLQQVKGNSLLKHAYSGSGTTINVSYILSSTNYGSSNALSQYSTNHLDSNYFGFNSALAINENILDFGEVSTLPILDGALNALNKPSPGGHGHVWKVIIDDSLDINIYDNVVHHLLAEGVHKVAVHFNRPMDVSVSPFVSFGVRKPYTQNIVGDSTSWSGDSTVWTGYFELSQLTASDGYNTMSIRNAYDNEGFIIPVEDYRFEFRVNISGVLSIGFNAVGDSSVVNVSWNRPDDIVDLIGYNVYRRDTTNGNGDTLVINSSMILDTVFVDENVIGGHYYQYFFTSLRSSFTESSRSSGVWATPYSSKPSVRTEKAVEPWKGTVEFSSKVDANFISTDARYLFGTSKSNLSSATSWEDVGSNFYEVGYTRSISSVPEGAVYYYQVQAKNSLGVVTGRLDSILTESTPALTISGPTQICLGDSISLSVQSVTPDTTMSLEWRYNGSVIGQGTSVKYFPTSQGTYSIELVAEGSYTTTTNETYDVSVVSGASNNVTIAYTGSTQLCQGDALTLALPSGYTDIVWNTGDTTATLTVDSTGTYSATLMSTTSTCPFTSTAVNVSVSPLPSATLSGPATNAFCDGETVTLTASGGTGYVWFENGTQISGATGSTLQVSAAGNYTVEASNSAGCSDLSTIFALTANPLPIGAISNASSLEFCQGDSVVLSAPSGMDYSWSTGDTTASISVSTTQAVDVEITDANGCSVSLPAVSVVSNFVPTLALTSSGSTAFCAGSSVNLLASGGFTSYSWNNGASTQSLTVNTAGTYTVTGTTADGCTTSASETVTVNAAPVATITNSGSNILCSGDSATLTAPAGMSSYLWSDGSTTQSITTPNAGNYNVTITNADGCSATSAAVAITTSQITSPSITASGVLEFCDGGSVTLGVPMGYASYAWNTNANSTQLTANQSGDYYVSVTNSDGCSITSDTVTVVVNPLPATPTITYTANDTLMISSATQGNQWYFNGVGLTGATDDTLRPYNFGNYSVMTMHANGCESGMSAMQFYNSIGATEDLMSQLSMYPNPTTGSVTLRFGTLEVDEVTVQDALGRVITTLYPEDAELRISLEEQPAGMYMIRVRTATGQVLNLNVAKQ